MVKWMSYIEFGELKWKNVDHEQMLIVLIIIIIIIIIKKGRHCKAEREWCTPYQSEDPSPTIPTNRQKEEKGKKSRDYSREREA